VSVQSRPSSSQVGASAVQPAAEEQPEGRPYPGSDEARTRERRMSATSFRPAARTELDAESLEKNVVDDEEGAVRKPREAMTSPHMAPSLRRRGEGRKRGFFKRLFGIR